MGKAVKDRACPNTECGVFGTTGRGKIVLHGFLRLKRGRRRRYYNFVRPHLALKFRSEVRTPAMEAGLVAKRLTFRDVFTAVAEFLLVVALAIRVRCRRQELIPRSAPAW